MAVQRISKRRVESYLDELETLILGRFPEAEFEVRKQDAHEYDLLVYGELDLTDIDDVVRDRPTDILLESGIHIHVLPLGRRIASS